MSTLPVWFRRFLLDAVQGAITGIVLLNIVIPGSLEEAQSQALILGAAAIRVVIGAVAAAGTQAIPAFLAWLSAKLNLPDSDT